MRLKELLTESAASQKQEIERLFKECSRKYFKDVNNPRPNPTFRVRSYRGRWGSYHPTKNEIHIHPDCFTDDDVLKSIVYHETIHWWDHEYDDRDFSVDTGHGNFFKERMKMINRSEGKELVTITAPKTIIKRTAKPYYVYGFVAKGKTHYFWTRKDLPEHHLKAAKTSVTYGAKEYYWMETDLPTLQTGKPVTAKATRWDLWAATEDEAAHIKDNAKFVTSIPAVERLSQEKEEADKQALVGNPIYVFGFESGGSYYYFWTKNNKMGFLQRAAAIAHSNGIDKVFRMETEEHGFEVVPMLHNYKKRKVELYRAFKWQPEYIKKNATFINVRDILATVDSNEWK